ncbi:MAG: 50S ribosomal protein L25 [Lentimicrobiaceae bacterium]|nr:50S ribosomal protein L25 [Lentimicrobiaceae bacterium]MCB9024014.1 50S ribosomal protein L25 [Lentimicrobiaceae bacterium]MCO5265772.1 50S ribosomal protein L25 [Lentimicrobium sp.]HPG32387.1 50S ribosomal protein L25 [Lentimicrobium sp.]
MKVVSLSGSLRGNVGKKDAKAQRKAERVPCVIYGGKEQIHFSAEETSFKPILNTPFSHLININIDGKEYLTILQDVQSHPVSDSILHADFLELQPEKPVTIAVPIKITGVSPGVLIGGKLIKKFRKLKVKALISNLPDEIEINIGKLEINQSIRVSDLKVENVQFLDIPSSVVVTVISTRNVEQPAPGK